MKVAGQAPVDKVYSTLSPELRKLAYNQGGIEQLNTQELMKETIKLLGVSVLHTAAHMVTLYKAEQVLQE